MNKMLEALSNFAKYFGIAEIQGLSKSEYLIAQWAQKHGFVAQDRTAFTLRLPKEGK
jgi:hypothetical protein